MKRLLTAALLLIACYAAAMAANETQTVAQVAEAVSLTADVDYHISGSEPFTETGSIDIVNTDHAVVIFDALKPSLAKAYLTYIKINGEAAADGSNCQLKLYNRGAILLPYGGSSFRALTVFSEQDFGGESESNSFTEGAAGGFMKNVSNAWNNRIQSFKLKRGYMVTFALKKGGWGYSRCFIAADADLEMNLPTLMAGRISSYRIFKWYDAGKAALADNTSASDVGLLNATSCYKFGLGESRLPDAECVPHHIFENWPSPSECGGVSYSCHLKTNNEPLNPEDPNPQDLETILANWENLMRTGQRLCTPSSWDGSDYWNGTGKLIKPFLDSIDARGWRCDIVDAHCYWTGNFDALQNYWVKNYKRPVWVSEWCWGASWNNNGSFSGSATETSFANAIKDITTILNNSAGVERYFFWNSENGNYPCKLIRDGNLSQAGKYYANIQSPLAYNGSVNYIPTAPRTYAPSDLSATFNANKMTCTLTWNSKNGDLANTVELQRRAGYGRWETIAEWTGNELEDETEITYTDVIEEAAAYEYRVVETLYTNKTLTSNIAYNVINASEGGEDFQFGSISSPKEEFNITFFSHPFEAESPIVVIGDPSYASISVIQNLSMVLLNSAHTHYSNFKMRYHLLESDSENTKTTKLTTTYLAAKAGRGIYGNLHYEAGTVNDGKFINCQTEYQVTFSEPFATTPVVFATPSISNANITAVMWRIYDVTTEGFKIQLLKESTQTTKVAGPCNFIAMEPGTYTNGEGTIFTVGTEDMTFSSLPQTITLSDEVENPRILTQLQTNNNEAAACLRYTCSTSSTVSSFMVRMTVDKSNTEKVLTLNKTTDERIGYLIISDGDMELIDKIEVPKTSSSENGIFTTLTGIRLSHPVRSGVYILNGKKVFVK
ncbi:MAG: H-type lectin domain-containing protein [Bacteroidales bacterium]|nr:H-type lectin domain-containing protein [Bacteroidales bacterium]